MTVEEFSREFDILYDSIASLSAPGVDEYEKSVFLTKAQLELIKEVNGPLNKYKQSFEGSDKRRADLRELIVPYRTTPVKITNGIEPVSYLVTLPDDVFLIKYEAALYKEPGCDNYKEIRIVPVKYDEYHENKRNPFRRPSKIEGFRLDVKSSNGKKQAELVVGTEPEVYQMRYIKYPNPIILTDLDGFSDEALSIDGKQAKTECELDEEFHREILDRAVQLAMVAYKQEQAQLEAQSNQLNN